VSAVRSRFVILTVAAVFGLSACSGDNEVSEERKVTSVGDDARQTTPSTSGDSQKTTSPVATASAPKSNSEEPMPSCIYEYNWKLSTSYVEVGTFEFDSDMPDDSEFVRYEVRLVPRDDEVSLPPAQPSHYDELDVAWYVDEDIEAGRYDVVATMVVTRDGSSPDTQPFYCYAIANNDRRLDIG